jgi:hypothetical protein
MGAQMWLHNALGLARFETTHRLLDSKIKHKSRRFGGHVELTNSKRLLYTANYVSTLLKPEEQQVFDNPGGGLRKAQLLRSLRLSPMDIGPLRESFLSHAPREHQVEANSLFSVLQRLTAADRPISTWNLRQPSPKFHTIPLRH